DAIGFGASFTSYRIGPVLMCEQGARLRNLDLGVAAADAKQWWETGQVPLRATPIKGGASPPPDEGLSEITLAAGPASKPSREKADRSPELESAKHQPDPDHYACVAKILQMTKLAQQELLKRSGL